MFEKFGEFDSFKELNEAAEGLKEEGDIENLKILGKENGIDEEDIEDYIEDTTNSLATAFTAALGRLNVEKRQTKDPAQILIIMMTSGMITDAEIASGVMKKGKRTEKILSEMKKGAKNHRKGDMGVSCGTDRQLREIIRIYYTQTEKELKKEVQKLYK